jgi:hypothetical protein
VAALLPERKERDEDNRNCAREDKYEKGNLVAHFPPVCLEGAEARSSSPSPMTAKEFWAVMLRLISQGGF